MRRGEVLGLTWDDFDAERRTLTVRRALSQVGPTQVIVKEPKTGRSRSVVIHDSMVEELTKHRQWQLGLKEALGCEYSDKGRICANPDGGMMTPSLLSKQFKRICRANRIDLTFHGLRHTQATTLITSGVPVRVVSERLGHSNTSITQDIYTHVLPHMQEKAAEVIGQLMDGDRDDARE